MSSESFETVAFTITSHNIIRLLHNIPYKLMKLPSLLYEVILSFHLICIHLFYYSINVLFFKYLAGEVNYLYKGNIVKYIVNVF